MQRFPISPLQGIEMCFLALQAFAWWVASFMLRRRGARRLLQIVAVLCAILAAVLCLEWLMYGIAA